MLIYVEYPLSFQIALAVQVIVALGLFLARGWGWALTFAICCPLIWFVGLMLASGHLAFGIESLWAVPVVWLVIGIVSRIRLTSHSRKDAPSSGAPLN